MTCYWCQGDCGGTCLNLSQSTQMRPSDPAYRMLGDGVTSTPTVFRAGCYICEDPEFAQMGLPLCSPCGRCSGHVPADDPVCDDCGADQTTRAERDVSARTSSVAIELSEVAA